MLVSNERERDEVRRAAVLKWQEERVFLDEAIDIDCVINVLYLIHVRGWEYP
jgi:hypothetical protein